MPHSLFSSVLARARYVFTQHQSRALILFYHGVTDAVSDPWRLHLPPARFLLADRAYSSAAFRQALADRGITPCIPPHAKHRIKHAYDPILYRRKRTGQLVSKGRFLSAQMLAYLQDDVWLPNARRANCIPLETSSVCVPFNADPQIT